MNFRILNKKAVLVTEKWFQHHKTQAQDVFAYWHFNTLLIVEVKYLFFGAQSISITLDTFQLHISIEGALASATHGIGTAHLHRTSDGGCLAAGKLRKSTVTQVTKICLTTSWFGHGRLKDYEIINESKYPWQLIAFQCVTSVFVVVLYPFHPFQSK